MTQVYSWKNWKIYDWSAHRILRFSYAIATFVHFMKVMLPSGYKLSFFPFVIVVVVVVVVAAVVIVV